LGVYFGSGAGRFNQTVNDSSTNSQTFVPIPPGTTQTFVSTSSGLASRAGDTTGSVVNLFAGYNWQPNPSWVIGGQLEGTVFSDITGKAIGTQRFSSLDTSTFTTGGVVTTTTTTTNTGNRTSEGSDELRSMFSFLGRVGFLATPNVLLYGLGGGTIGNFVLPSGGEDSFGGKRNKWVLGYTAGAGGELKLNRNWSLRAEYRYVNFKFDRDDSNSSSSTFASATSIQTFSSSNTTLASNKFDMHLGTIGVAYRFCYCD